MSVSVFCEEIDPVLRLMLCECWRGSGMFVRNILTAFYFHGERVWKVVCETFLYVCWGCVRFTVGFAFHRGFTRCGIIMVKRVLIMLVSFLGMKLIYLRVWVMLVWHSSMDSGLCVAVWVVWVVCGTSCGLWISRLLANHHQLNNDQSYLSPITPLGA